MIGWLADTLLYTGLLIALILAVRGYVARCFGPRMAYALWALPLLRFIMPPVVLPAQYAPRPEAAEGLTTIAPLADIPVFPAYVPAQAGPGLSDMVVGIWLAGAVLFLGWRWWNYRAMRRNILAGARPVGEVGTIRLVESPATDAPVAFGVLDRVIALPQGFMAHEDRTARDLAIEHEIAHHRGCDLLANILAQPILALHWFNPLAWLGWRAMRRDQEAACDARVMACRDPGERALYGEVIARFATGRHIAPAAPLACPMASRMWGEKSIIHRLRSLGMSDISPRRRLAGYLLMAGAVLALPLTASVTYAEAPRVPLPPEAPQAPLAPVALEAPLSPESIPAEAEVASAPAAVAAPQPAEPASPVSEEDREESLWEESWTQSWEESAMGSMARAMQVSAFEFTCDDEPQSRRFAFCASEYADAHARAARAHASAALARTRDTIARQRNLTEDIKSQILQSLDREIERLRKEG